MLGYSDCNVCVEQCNEHTNIEAISTTSEFSTQNKYLVKELTTLTVIQNI